MAKFCMKCGASLEENVKFCKACGTPVGDVARKDASEQTIRMAPPRVEPSRSAVAPTRRSGNSSTGVIVAVALVIAALCGGGGYYYYQSHHTVATDTESSSKDKKGGSENTSSSAEKDDKSKEEQSKVGSTSQNSAMDKAKSEMAEYGIKGEFTTTSYGHSQDGFIAVDSTGQVVVIDRKNHRAGMVKPRMSLAEFQRQRNEKVPMPMIMDCTFTGDAKDNDATAGYWKGTTHYMTIYADYSFDGKGNIVPGMLTTARGEHPSHYQEVLYEVRNVDFANLFLTEAIGLKV